MLKSIFRFDIDIGNAPRLYPLGMHSELQRGHYLLSVLSMSILFLIAKVISIVMRPIMGSKCYRKHCKRNQTELSDYSYKPTYTRLDFPSPSLLQINGNHKRQKETRTKVFSKHSLYFGTLVVFGKFQFLPSKGYPLDLYHMESRFSISETLY